MYSKNFFYSNQQTENCGHGFIESVNEENSMSPSSSATAVADRPEFEADNHVDSLDVSVNRLRDLDLPGWTHSILYLNLSSNLLRSLNGIGACKLLQSIEANDNYIDDVSDLSSCQELIVIKLAGNKIEIIPKSWRFAILEHLDLTNNDLKDFQCSKFVSIYAK